jgi:hypothetical protein
MHALKKGIAAAALVALSNLIAIAQSGTIAGPDLGFVQSDSGDAMWPVFGVPGASALGERLKLPSGIVVASIAPQHDYAIARQSESGQTLVVVLDAVHPVIIPLEEAALNPKRVTISPTGRAVGFYSDELRTLQVISGLPRSAVKSFEFDTSILPGAIDEFAVSDDAQLALVSVKSGDNSDGGLWAVNASGAWLVASGGRFVIAFLSGRHDALIASDGSQEISVWRDIDQSLSRLPLAVLASEEPHPFQAVAAASARTVVVTQRDSDIVTILDLVTGLQSAVSCGCSPTGLFPLK